MKQVDARGLTCPKPVIEAKKALKENNCIEVLVDNQIATENLKKLAEVKQYKVNVIKESNQSFKVILSTGSSNSPVQNNVILEPNKSNTNVVVAVDTEVMGQGNQQLGESLMKSFIYALSEQDFQPTCILFYNGGAKLTVENSPVLEDLKGISERGVSILTCGACLDFYGLTERLAVGEITNMYRIVELMSTAHHVVKP